MAASDLKVYKDDAANGASQPFLMTDEPPTQNKNARILIALPEKPAIVIWR
jgi:hypothetical protein